MNAPKFFNILMAIFFVVATAAPLILVNKDPGKISTAENRTLAAFPPFKASEGGINTHFAKDFENWFNDNLGLRDQLVMANTKIQYDAFGELTKKDTLIGKNNWLFYVTPEIIKDYQNLDLPSEQKLTQWDNSLDEINNYLKEKNIPFITMLNLDKKSIYPENYPDTINKVGETSRTDLIERKLGGNKNLDFFTPKEALLKAKTHTTVYSPRYDNAHWNYYGAFVGYLELMDRVKKYYPNVKVLSWQDFNITKYSRETKVYNSVSFSEVDYGLNFKGDIHAKETTSYLEGLNLTLSSNAHTFSNSNNKLPKALIIGDSYIYQFILPQLAESFSELTFIPSENIGKLQSYIDLFEPDIFIFENVERMWPYTMNTLAQSNEILKDYKEFKNLPLKADWNLWIDYFDNANLEKQNEFIINSSSKVINIIGWGIDTKKSNVAGAIYLKIGNKYYAGQYGIPRENVAMTYNNNKLTNSGFTFNIKREDLIKARKVNIVLISKDEKYQYISPDYKIKVR